MIKALFIGLLPAVAIAAPCPKWSIDEAQKQISQLQSEIRHHDNLYFNEHTAEISDAEYDQLTDQLTHFQSCFPSIESNLSFHQQVKGQAQWHQANMGSLKKASNPDDVQAFLSKAGKQTVLLQPKIDGIAVELVYQKGTLQSASTRGDGQRGLNIIQQIGMASAIPQHIPITEMVILHGELFARLDKMNNDLMGYTSARHFVSGHISRSDTDPNAMALLDFFPWHWVNSPYDSDFEGIEVLSSAGFRWTKQHTHKISHLKEVEALRQQFLQPPAPTPFLLDGIVIKIDDIETRKKWGSNVLAPNWALAWKFPTQTAITLVEDITFTIGRSGKITPVLNVETVHINKQSISSVSLGSIQVLHKRGIAIGDQIVIQLKGQATPTFSRVLIHNPDHMLPPLPDTNFYNSFSCLTLEPRCKQQFFARLQWLVGKHGLDLPYLNTSILSKLIQVGKITSLSSLFEFNKRDLISAGLDQSKASKLLKVLSDVSGLPFEQRIKAISLPNTGTTRTQLIAQHYQDFQTLGEASPKELSHIINSSDAFARTLLNFLKLPEVGQLVNKLSSTKPHPVRKP